MIIFGLGNPGIKYRWTRHNTGFIFLDHIAKKYKIKFHSYPEYKQAIIKKNEQGIRLIKPLLFMNRSGIVVSRVLENEPEDFLVVVDDINLPLGRLRFRARGSDGGHLGLRSIIETLQTEDFPRLRIGVANQESIGRRRDSAEFVLSRFERQEKEILKEVINKGIKGIEIYFAQGFEKAQNFINSIKIT